MIYVDTSVALAWILAEDRRPAVSFWSELVVSSRLLQYEVSTRLSAYGMTPDRQTAAREITSVLAFVELTQPVLERVLDPFPMPVRTLDALHLATLDYLSHHVPDVVLASFDERMNEAARAMGHGLHTFPR